MALFSLEHLLVVPGWLGIRDLLGPVPIFRDCPCGYLKDRIPHAGDCLEQAKTRTGP